MVGTSCAACGARATYVATYRRPQGVEGWGTKEERAYCDGCAAQTAVSEDRPYNVRRHEQAVRQDTKDRAAKRRKVKAQTMRAQGTMPGMDDA